MGEDYRINQQYGTIGLHSLCPEDVVHPRQQNDVSRNGLKIHRFFSLTVQERNDSVDTSRVDRVR